MTGAYDDIINLPRPTSSKHPRMSLSDRAAQFSPFAALSGHEAAIRETARLTDRRIELDEDVKVELDRKLRLVADHLAERPRVSITFFEVDDKKEGGSYRTATGPIKRIDDVRRLVIMQDGREIPVDDISGIESELLIQTVYTDR